MAFSESDRKKIAALILLESALTYAASTRVEAAHCDHW
jgi:hypothetical protein